MNIQNVPFCTVNWNDIVPVIYPGITGEARWRSYEEGNIRVRIVEYTPGYLADHWCTKGHVVLVLDGELTTELEDGREFIMRPGTSYQVSDGTVPHRSRTETGALLFIVD